MKPKLICLILGCKWQTTLRFLSLNEHLITQQCTRCCAQRTVTE